MSGDLAVIREAVGVLADRGRNVSLLVAMGLAQPLREWLQQQHDELAGLLALLTDPDPDVVPGYAEAQQVASAVLELNRAGARRHLYLSTGCLHDEHWYCRSMTGVNGEKRPAQCKFCKAPCVCWCHGNESGRGGTPAGSATGHGGSRWPATAAAGSSELPGAVPAAASDHPGADATPPSSRRPADDTTATGEVQHRPCPDSGDSRAPGGTP